MAQERDDRTGDLAERVRALELALAASREVAQRSGTRRRVLISLSYLIPVLAFAGWAVAQTEQPSDGPVRKVGDITQVTAPFQVVDASGTVLLSVATEPNARAATSIAHTGHGGIVQASSSTGVAMAVIAAGSNGFGTIFANDASGRPRSFLFGSGGVAVHNEAGKQVAGLLALADQKGKVGVWGAGGQSIIDLTESPSGVGLLSIYDKSRQRLVTAGAEGEGDGRLSIFAKGKTAASVDLGVNQAGAGDLILRTSTGALGLEASGFPTQGIRRGGQLRVFNEAGSEVLVVASTSQGKGQVALGDQSGTLAELFADDTGGNLLLTNAGRQTTVNVLGGAAGGGSIIASNDTGELVASLGSSAGGKGALLIVDANHPAAELSADAAGVGTLTLSNAAGQSTLEASGDSAGGGGVNLSTNAGDLVVVLGSSDGRGSVSLVEKGIAAAELMSDSAGAGSLVLRNAAGKVTINAAGDASGGGNIALSDNAGELAAILGASGEGKGFLQIVTRNSTAAELTADSSGAGWLLLNDAAGKVAVDATGADQVVGIGVYRQGQLVAGIGTSDDGKGRVSVYGKNGGVAELVEGDGGHGVLRVMNANGIAVAGMTGGNGDAGAVTVTNSAGAATAELSTTSYGEGQLGIYDPAGSGLWAVVTRDPEGGGGVVQVMSATHTVGSLMAKPTGGGYLQLLSSAGNVAVEAGAAASGRGVVRAGPRFKCEPSGGLGLTLPDCIMGLP